VKSNKLQLSYSNLKIENLGPSAILELTISEFSQLSDLKCAAMDLQIKLQHHRPKRGRVIDDFVNFTAV